MQQVLADPEAGVRAAAARALGKLKYHRAREELQDCLEDGSWAVRAAARAALVEIAKKKKKKNN